ncbi:MBG domain-containing protein [Chitinophaga lutea]
MIFISLKLSAQAPVITAISPRSALPGTTLTITGSGFSPTAANNIVRVGHVKAVVTAASAGQLSVTVPGGALTGPVTVTNTATSLSAISRHYFVPRQIISTTSLSPADFKYQGAAYGGMPVGSVLAADMNDDGRPDLVAGEHIPPTPPVHISVLPNQTLPGGPITFQNQSPVNSTNVDLQGALTVADLDNDGKLDIISPVSYIHSVHTLVVVPGQPGNMLTFPLSSPSGEVTNASAADIDGDGKIDVVANISYSPGMLQVLRNTSPGPGTIALDLPLSVMVGLDPLYSATTDIDGDNKPDFLTVGNAGLAVSLNNSTPGNILFQGFTLFSGDFFPTSMALGDVNGDGQVDIVVTYDSAPVAIYLNTSSAGAASFTKSSLPLLQAQHGAHLADFNGDGKPDLLVGNTSSPFVSLMVNMSTINTVLFSAVQRVNFPELTSTSRGLTSGDFDGDGIIDFIAGEYNSGLLHIYRGNTTPIPTMPATSVQAVPQLQSATLSWTNGNGAKRAVFMLAGSAATTPPADLTDYTANAVFGAGSQIGSTGWYCVYNGTANTVNVTGLTPKTNYRAMVVEYNDNGQAGNARYQPILLGGNPADFQTLEVINLNCDRVTAETNLIYGVCAGCNVAQAGNAADGDSTTASILDLATGQFNAYAEQTLIFPSPGLQGDTVTLLLKIPPSLLATDALPAIEIRSYNGATPNSDARTLNNPLVRVTIDAGRIWVRFRPSAVYDRLQIRAHSGQVANFTSLEVYYAHRLVSQPVITALGAVPICPGTSALLNASSNGTIDWYEQPAGGSIIPGAGSAPGYITPALTTAKTFYAEAKRISNGCSNPERTPFFVDIIAPPAFTQQPQPATAPAGQQANFTVAATGGGTLEYKWQIDMAGNGNYIYLSETPNLYMNVLTPTLTLGLQAPMSGAMFRCAVSNGCTTVFSDGAQLTVGKIAQTLAFSSLTDGGTTDRTYGDATIDASATATSGLLPAYASSDASVATIDGAGVVTILKAGTTIITVSQGGNTNMYDPATPLTCTLRIAPKTLTVSANARTQTYGDVAQPLTYAATGFAYNDDATLAISGGLTRDPGDAAGVYNILPGTLSAGPNYSIAFTGNTYTIHPAPLLITANNAAKTYGAADPALTYTASGFANGDDLSILAGSLQRTAGEAAGSYPITIGSLQATNNYTLQFTGSTFTIGKAMLSITANAISKTYGAADPALTYTASGFANGDNNNSLTGALQRSAGENAGIYPIAQGTLQAGNNYTVQFTPANFTIQKVPLRINANAQTKTYGAADPSLTYTATGLVNGETISVLNGSLQRTAGENAGVYDIIAGTLASNNYILQFTGNTFTITKAAQAIAWNQQLTFGCSGNAPVQLTGVSSSGLPVTYSVSNNAVATLSGNTLTPGQGGYTTVTASQAGDVNYLPAPSVTQNIQVQLAGLVRQQWSDVLAFDNSSSQYTQWQWYKNGSAVAGATKQYYHENVPLNGTYYVIATETGGLQAQSCPITLTGSGTVAQGIRISQNPVARGANVTVTCSYPDTDLVNATLQLTDLSGRVVHQQASVQATQQVRMPAAQGLYILTLQLRDGRKASINVLVQ